MATKLACHLCGKPSQVPCLMCIRSFCLTCIEPHLCDTCIACAHQGFSSSMFCLQKACDQCLPRNYSNQICVFWDAPRAEGTTNFIRLKVDQMFSGPVKLKIFWQNSRERNPDIINKDITMGITSELKNAIHQGFSEFVIVTKRPSSMILQNIIREFSQYACSLEIIPPNSDRRSILRLNRRHCDPLNQLMSMLELQMKNGVILYHANSIRLLAGFPPYSNNLVQQCVQNGFLKQFVFEYPGKPDIYFYCIRHDTISDDLLLSAILALERSQIKPYLSRILDIVNHVYGLDEDPGNIIARAIELKEKGKLSMKAISEQDYYIGTAGFGVREPRPTPTRQLNEVVKLELRPPPGIYTSMFYYKYFQKLNGRFVMNYLYHYREGSRNESSSEELITHEELRSIARTVHESFPHLSLHEFQETLRNLFAPRQIDFEEMRINSIEQLLASPSSSANASEASPEPEDCAVCLEPLDEDIFKLSCTHTFHSHCILDFYKSGLTGSTCFMCTRPIIDEDIRRLQQVSLPVPRSNSPVQRINFPVQRRGRGRRSHSRGPGRYRRRGWRQHHAGSGWD